MKGNRISISFQGVNWWDTLSREQQLLYIQQHTTKKKPKIREVAAKVAGQILHRASQYKNAFVDSLGSAKEHFKKANALVREGKPEKLSPEQKQAYKKVYLNTGVKMLMLFAASLALAPILPYAPLMASMYINWRLENQDREPSRDDSDPDDENLLDKETKASLAAQIKKQKDQTAQMTKKAEENLDASSPQVVPAEKDLDDAQSESPTESVDTNTAKPDSTEAPQAENSQPASAPISTKKNASEQMEGEDDPELKDYFDFLRKHAETVAIEEQKAAEKAASKKKKKQASS